MGNKRLQQLLQAVPQALGHAARAAIGIVLSSPIQGGLLLVNIVLVKSGLSLLAVFRPPNNSQFD